VFAIELATLIGFMLCVVLLGMNTYFLIKIFQVIRRHTLQIQAQQQSQQSIDMKKYRKSTKIMYCLIGAFALCYVPYVISMVTLGMAAELTRMNICFHVIAETLMMFNGVLNPIFYCWRMEEMRNAARTLL
jgi:flagellar biosynthesis protein FlhB